MIEEVGIYSLAVAAVGNVITLVAQQRIGVLGLGSYSKLAPVVIVAIVIALINGEAELQRKRSLVVVICLNSYRLAHNAVFFHDIIAVAADKGVLKCMK